MHNNCYKLEPDDPITYTCDKAGCDNTVIVMDKHWKKRAHFCASCLGVWVHCPECDCYQAQGAWCGACGAELLP